MTEGSKGADASGHQELGQHQNSNGVLTRPIYDWLLLATIVLSPFQDTALQNTPLRLFAASPSVLPLIALFVLATFHLLSGEFVFVRRSTLIMAGYAVAVSIASLLWGYADDGTLYWRLLRSYALSLPLILFTVFGLKYHINRSFKIAVYLAFLFTIAGIASGQVLGPNAISLLQVSVPALNRPHGFSTESSTLSIQIVTSGFLTIHFLPSNWQKWSVCGLTCALLLFSSSKGGLISLLLCAVVLGIVVRRSFLLAKIGMLLVVPLLLYWGLQSLGATFVSLFEAGQSNTIATRLSMAVYALIAVAHNPLGVGVPGFLPSLPHYLPQAMNFVQKRFPILLDFREVQGYLTPPHTDADCKTFFFNFLAFFGIPFAVVFFCFIGRLLIGLLTVRHYWLFIGVLFSVFALMTYYSSVNAYSIPLLFGVSLYEIRRAEDAVRMS